VPGTDGNHSKVERFVVTLAGGKDMLTMTDIQRIRTLKDARQFLGLSLRQASLLFNAKGTRSNTHVSKATICGWQSGYRVMPPEAVKRLGELLAEKLTNETKRTVGVRIAMGRTWRVTAWAKCIECGKWFCLPRFRIRRCSDCLAQIAQNHKKRQARQSHKRQM
jgi:hypothetical protein